MLRISLILCAAIALFSCNDDDVIESELHYDGPNQSAPLLDEGTHVAAARFPASFTAQYTGRSLESIEYYLLDLPAELGIRVYGQGTATEPGPEIYSAAISGAVQANAWNEHRLATPIDLTGDDIWIAVRVVHNSTIPTVGCDPGPAVENGDWLQSSDDNAWRTLRDRTGQAVNINWNIRGNLAD